MVYSQVTVCQPVLLFLLAADGRVWSLTLIPSGAVDQVVADNGIGVFRLFAAEHGRNPVGNLIGGAAFEVHIHIKVGIVISVDIAIDRPNSLIPVIRIRDRIDRDIPGCTHGNALRHLTASRQMLDFNRFFRNSRLSLFQLCIDIGLCFFLGKAAEIVHPERVGDSVKRVKTESGNRPLEFRLVERSNATSDNIAVFKPSDR